MMKKKGKKIFDEFEKSHELEEKGISNYIPEERVMAFISALKSSFDQIEQLSEEIETSETDKNWKISIDFRLILEFLRAVFRLNSYDIERILINPENSLLLQFLENFTDNVYLSNEEWCNRKDLFSKYQTQIEELAWEIKDQYHKLIWESYIGSYIDYCKFTGTSPGPNVENLLEHINFTKFYPDQILEWNNKYPDDLMLKAFIYMKLDMIPSVPQLNYKLNKRIRFRSNWIRATGTALGLYHSSPKMDKLYRFKRALKENKLHKIIEKNAEFLMMEGISDPIILIG
ncbi:MAG: hypothetical protein GF329_08590, partial [Candidatus Lokiarchaeota archaeon]|nr:hypothetical protein [Candidatus Lokiarchaeota archaeon]